MGARRAANGHPEPYHVRVWGLGNEVWGEWQVGHTDAAGYVQRIKPFISAMRAVDPEIELVAVGLDMLAGDPRHAEAWNRTVLEGIGDQIDHTCPSMFTSPARKATRRNMTRRRSTITSCPRHTALKMRSGGWPC